LAIAAFIAWKLTVANAINIAAKPATTKIHRTRSARWFKMEPQVIIEKEISIARHKMLIAENHLCVVRWRTAILK